MVNNNNNSQLYIFYVWIEIIHWLITVFATKIHYSEVFSFVIVVYSIRWIMIINFKVHLYYFPAIYYSWNDLKFHLIVGLSFFLWKSSCYLSCVRFLHSPLNYLWQWWRAFGEDLKTTLNFNLLMLLDF